MDERRSHYEVLGVPQDAIYEQIKESFHRLARAKHPDKQTNRTLQDGDQHDGDQIGSDKNSNTNRKGSETQAEKSAAEFRRIQQAWQILRDPEERKAYDSDLFHKDLQEENRRNGAIVLSYHDDLEEALDEETNERFMVYDCRCGEEIHIEESDGEEDGTTGQRTRRDGPGDDLLVDCPGCCFVYRIVGK
mmetsp:Transcript_14572/g.40498  ORF Transcript_14572/g.40498 Transcript_14572/m.40498 type:complete len:190 (+) Transcript_14572:237-806(+)|eukprot:CAMPEP_0172368336 /NCGR_PEP_ID=MMETSP1060-20121228/26469_1 /TAXON_ID=37318 /ORGANISM="Pseudo-nitzschia pungens, Strain cf. cingulata" /LENGTH=189 /DNA_ID=CAMNT_0013092891 /DNA_START=204 /DNA_END=773 /DNA_ORIENTATION=+